LIINRNFEPKNKRFLFKNEEKAEEKSVKNEKEIENSTRMKIEKIKYLSGF
jgi:hypothetical protein